MRIIWPYDPFEKNNRLRLWGERLIMSLFDPEEDEITAVYVASPNESQLTNAFDVPRESRFTDYPRQLMQDQLHRLHLDFVNIEVIPTKSISLTQEVKILAAYALKNYVDLIVIPTRAKKTLSLLFLGSFAESLTHYSETNLLFYNEKTTLEKRPKKLVFAHDFSRKGTNGLPVAMKFAKKWDMNLNVIHVPSALYALFSHQHKKSVEYKKFVDGFASHIDKSCARQGIECTTHIEFDPEKSEREVLINACRKHRADIVATAARTTSLLGGFVTRFIIRTARVPILVIKV